MAASDDQLHLVLAGPLDPDCPPLEGKRVRYLGMLAHAETARLFASLDVGIIYLRDTPFGRFCFPQKAFEMMACQLPIVATAVGMMPQLLADQPDHLYREGTTKT